jgi:hypothetical protein
LSMTILFATSSNVIVISFIMKRSHYKVFVSKQKLEYASIIQDTNEIEILISYPYIPYTSFDH